jgi:hypothetical protein
MTVMSIHHNCLRVIFLTKWHPVSCRKVVVEVPGTAKRSPFLTDLDRWLEGSCVSFSGFQNNSLGNIAMENGHGNEMQMVY